MTEYLYQVEIITLHTLSPCDISKLWEIGNVAKSAYFGNAFKQTNIFNVF